MLSVVLSCQISGNLLQEARKNNNPQDLLNETVNNFSPQQRQQWDQLISQFNR